MSKKIFKMRNDYNQTELFKLFGKYARYIPMGQFYAIDFNGKTLSADNPSDLFKKVQDEYKIIVGLDRHCKVK